MQSTFYAKLFNDLMHFYKLASGFTRYFITPHVASKLNVSTNTFTQSMMPRGGIKLRDAIRMLLASTLEVSLLRLLNLRDQRREGDLDGSRCK